jgi:microcin C transport system substrate-binding protein
MFQTLSLLAVSFLVVLALPIRASDAEVAARHGFAMYGDPKYGADFEHFEYVRPDAPKGGRVRLAVTGSFDSLNPFTPDGVSAVGLMSLVFETLTTPALDEPFSEYGLLAKAIEVSEDRSWVAFSLRSEARWQDGERVTVEDVLFSFEFLQDKDVFYRLYYKDVKTPEVWREYGQVYVQRYRQPRAALNCWTHASASEAPLRRALNQRSGAAR